MTSWPDVKPFLRVGEFRQRRCERALGQARQRLQALEIERQAQDEQQRSLRQFMTGQYPSDQVLSREQLMTLLRRQAVLRRQLHLLGIDRVRLDEQQADVQAQWQALAEQRQGLQRKQGRYEALAHRLNRQRRAVEQLRDENENEEGLHLRAGPLLRGA